MNQDRSQHESGYDDDRQRRFLRRVVVKFRDGVEFPQSGDIEGSLNRVGPWGSLIDRFPGLRIDPLFDNQAPETIQDLVRRARRQDPTYRLPNLLTYYAVEVPAEADPEEIAKELQGWDNVQMAYVEPGPVEPPVPNPGDDPRSGNQGYLDPAPDGIDAEFAWSIAGGDGQGQALVDLEWGWNFNHEDLVTHGISLISGLNYDYFWHGTAVLGEIAADDNTVGCIGITPELTSVRVVGQWLSGGGYSTSQPILDAIATMDFGDVLLLEAQTAFAGYSNVPVETEPAVFDVIRLATALGIIVVEAAGNGAVDLDTVSIPVFGQVLNRTSADFRDSGAIIIGAASSVTPHTRMGFSCYGSRVDCYAWGQNVDTAYTNTTGSDNDDYTGTFSGTSSASPIVTGAALALQGIAEANLGYRFSPWQIRSILSNPATGTASANPPVDRIGVMPDLRAIIEDVLFVRPEVYIRDFVGDSGDPHAGAISASPDIIVRPVAVANPQAAFGEGSGTENDNTLGFEVESGQDNFIYVRVRNRGGTPAVNVDTTVYWSPVATLVTPDLWTLVGMATLPNVPTGDQLTVSDAITWDQAEIPGEGHYCFVGLIGNAQDPAPAPADFIDFDNFRIFIRNNNNVTWRNFNVVDNLPDPPESGTPPGFKSLAFLAPGAPDKSRRMALEVVARLPEKAELQLEAPLYLIEFLAQYARIVEIDRTRGIARLALKPQGRHWLGEQIFPAKARHQMRLLVHIPEEQRMQSFEVHVRQLFEEEEVGRVAWRLVPDEQFEKRRVV